MNKHTFHVQGTHCKSCKILIEELLQEQGSIQSARVDLAKKLVMVETVNKMSSRELVSKINTLIEPSGYVVAVEKVAEGKKDEAQLWKAVGIGAGVLVLFFWLQQSGILNIGFGGQMTPVTGFLVGLLASVSSCLAVVGGLVLSMSAKISKDRVNGKKTLVLFHGSRLISFALLGAVLGGIGGALGVNFMITALLGIIASLVMLYLGLNLVGVFENRSITLPTGAFSFFKRFENSSLAPVALGFATFFLPCGFTQAMQVSALSSGSVVSGFLILLAFSLGTLPVLALLSFGPLSFSRGKHAKLMFKSSGMVVIGLAVYALYSGLVVLGVVQPF